jgi:hypothetical protein
MNLKKYSSDCSSRICFNKTVLVIGLICFSVAFSCTSALYIPTATYETPNASLSELQVGRKSYIQKCGSCHTLYLPEKYTKQEWQLWVDKMTLKVSMDSLEKEQILKYLTKGR